MLIYQRVCIIVSNSCMSIYIYLLWYTYILNDCIIIFILVLHIYIYIHRFKTVPQTHRIISASALLDVLWILDPLLRTLRNKTKRSGWSLAPKSGHCRPMAHGLSWISDRWIPGRIHKTIYDPSPKYPDCCCLWMSLISLFTMNHHRFTIVLRLPCHSFATFWWLNTPRASRREVKTRKNNSNTLNQPFSKAPHQYGFLWVEVQKWLCWYHVTLNQPFLPSQSVILHSVNTCWLNCPPVFPKTKWLLSVPHSTHGWSCDPGISHIFTFHGHLHVYSPRASYNWLITSFKWYQ